MTSTSVSSKPGSPGSGDVGRHSEEHPLAIGKGRRENAPQRLGPEPYPRLPVVELPAHGQRGRREHDGLVGLEQRLLHERRDLQGREHEAHVALAPAAARQLEPRHEVALLAGTRQSGRTRG